MRPRLAFALTLCLALLAMLGAATASQASPGALRILIVSNAPDPRLHDALVGFPGVATVDTFDSSTGTPDAASLATYDLVAGTGDSSYQDASLWGDRLADFLDAGGAEIQFAYDNWNDLDASPAGRFASGGYAPFIPGPNPNTLTSLGQILVPSSPLLAGVPVFTTKDNTTDALAPGATLLAKWADGRNAIATKGRVLSVTASPESGGQLDPISAAAQLAVNAAKVLHAPVTTGQRAAALKKCKKKNKKHPNSKKFKKCKKRAKKLPL